MNTSKLELKHLNDCMIGLDLVKTGRLKLVVDQAIYLGYTRKQAMEFILQDDAVTKFKKKHYRQYKNRCPVGALGSIWNLFELMDAYVDARESSMAIFKSINAEGVTS